LCMSAFVKFALAQQHRNKARVRWSSVLKVEVWLDSLYCCVLFVVAKAWVETLKPPRYRAVVGVDVWNTLLADYSQSTPLFEIIAIHFKRICSLFRRYSVARHAKIGQSLGSLKFAVSRSVLEKKLKCASSRLLRFPGKFYVFSCVNFFVFNFTFLTNSEEKLP
jgi:hypothetical protein